MSTAESRPKRPELKVMRHTKRIASSRRGPLIVADVPELMIVAARHMSLIDLVVLGDSALHMGRTSIQELRVSAARNRWGARALSRAIDWMDWRSESPWETLLRVFHRTCRIPVVPQHEVRANGRFIARGDLWIVGSRMLHEYDGSGHRDVAAHRKDLTRDRALLGVGWVRRGYTAVDLTQRPEEILPDADQTLGRRHRVDRLDPWLSMLSESLFSRTGQQRFLRRLGLPESGRSRPVGRLVADRCSDTPGETAV